MRNGSLLVVALVLMGSVACSGLLLSGEGKAQYQDAQGPTGLETAINLANMMVLSVRETQSEPAVHMGLETINSQFEALNHAFSNMTREQISLPTYKQAVTLRQELIPLMSRLNKYRGEDEVRTAHLEMVNERLIELRNVLHSMLVYANVNPF